MHTAVALHPQMRQDVRVALGSTHGRADQSRRAELAYRVSPSPRTHMPPFMSRVGGVGRGSAGGGGWPRDRNKT